jgi:predicted Zn finger-like uncharacterized protein
VNLTTRCPNCGTAFRVQPVQLSARGGKVRCGKCTHVFDGVAALVADSADSEQGAQAETEPSPQLGLFTASRKEPARGAGEAANEDAPVANFLEEAPPPRRPGRCSSAPSCCWLRSQPRQRTTFAPRSRCWFPETRPYLIAACKPLKCDVKLPRRPKQMAIESSDLQADGRRDNVIVLNAVLRNQAPFAQEYPALELTLTDERDEALARRVLMPSDYLVGLPPSRWRMA